MLEPLLKLERCTTGFTAPTVGTDAALRTITVELLLLGRSDPAAAPDTVRTAAHPAGRPPAHSPTG